jgi:hypothetical protein
MCVFVHSHFIEKPPIGSWETNPYFFSGVLSQGHSPSTGDHSGVLTDDECHRAALSPPRRRCRDTSVSPRLHFRARRAPVGVLVS